MSVSVYVKEFWGWKATIEDVNKEVTYYRREDGSPYQALEKVAERVIVEGHMIFKEDEFYSHEKYGGMILIQMSESNEWLLGKEVQETEDLMYGISESIELSKIAPDSAIEFAKENGLDNPKHFILSIVC